MEQNNRFNTSFSSNHSQNQPTHLSGGGPSSMPSHMSSLVGPRLMSGGPGPMPGSSQQDNLEHSFGPDINSGRSSYKHHNMPYKNDGGQFQNEVKAPIMQSRPIFPMNNQMEQNSQMIDNLQGSSGPAGPQVSHQQYVQDAGGDIIGEENKLEDNFNQLQLNLPKSSNIRQQQQHNAQSVGGPVSGQNGSNFGKLQNQNYSIKQSEAQQIPQMDFIQSVKSHEKVVEYNKIEQINSFQNIQTNQIMSSPYDQQESSLIQDDEENVNEQIKRQNNSQKSSSSKKSQIEVIVEALSEYDQTQIQQIFIIHYDTMKQNKVILTEAQFDLIRKIYPTAFQNNRWSISEDQQLKQIFLNCKSVYEKVILKKQKQ